MNCLICSDKFKGSLSAQAACEAIHRGFAQTYPDYNYQLLPLADGGDGSLAVIDNYIGGTHIKVATADPLNRPIQASYLLNDTIAYVELAIASGIALLSKDERSALYTDTRGTGSLILDALRRGAREIILTLGGSCSTDAGLGIAAALGYKFQDREGNDVLPQGGYLSKIHKIVAPEALPSFSLNLLCDVNNPLFGPDGAAYVFAPQKGADKDEIVILDQGLRHISEVIRKYHGVDISLIPGGGSAGGIGAGLYGLLGASIESGFDTLSEMAGLTQAINQADIVITGEGQLDKTSLEGKVVGKVTQLCQQMDTPIMAIVGKNELSVEEVSRSYLRDIKSIYPEVEDIDDAITNAAEHLTAITSKLQL